MFTIFSTDFPENPIASKRIDNFNAITYRLGTLRGAGSEVAMLR